MKNVIWAVMFIGSSIALSGCGGASDSPVQAPPPIVATHFSVTPAATLINTGTPVSVTVSALAASGQIVTSYTGTVHFASTDGNASLPVDSALANGTASFWVILKTPGNQTITASDAAAALTGTSNAIKVSAPAPSPVPLVYQPLTPAAALPGGAAFKLTLNGTGFVPGSTVKWNGSARATSAVSNSQLTATILASDIGNANTASVTVVNPAPGGGESNVVFFETTNPTSFASWSAPSALTAGADPIANAAADFNGDGKLDMVVANALSGNVSILLGNGDGTFQPAVNYLAGSNPWSVAVGDFNGDGKLDLAVVNFGSSGNVSILLGNGDGTFQPAVSYLTGTNAASVALGDFDGDGKLDLAVANAGTGNVSILIGNGDGTFKTAVDYTVGQFPSSVSVGNFNGDGKLDLAVAIADNAAIGNVSILLGNGDGTFQTALTFPTNSNRSASVAVGDFNGDGKLDLAVANGGTSSFSNGDVSILLGNGDGTFKSAVNFPTTSWSSSFVAIGDFNGDGKLDLAVAGSCVACGPPTLSAVSVLLGNGDGTFQPANDHAAGNVPSSITVGDFNGDGRQDLADADGSTVSLLLAPVTPGPNATWSAATLDLGTQLVGTTSLGSAVTLSNNGTSVLNIASIAASTNFGETNDCGTHLAAGASCTVTVTFTPGAMGKLTGTLSITDDAPGNPQKVSLSGTGTEVDLSPGFLSFNCAPLCQPKTVTLTYRGTMTLNIGGIIINSPHAGTHFLFSEKNNCPASLGAGQSCTITVDFGGGVLGVSYSGTLDVVDDGGGSPQLVTLRGKSQ